MIDGLKPYPAMKDSGVPWLGEVPEHWEVQRLRNLTDMRVSNVDKHTKDDEQPVRLCNYVDVYKNDYIRPSMSLMRATATKEEVERFRLAEGDVLITKDSEAWNDIGVPALVRESADDLVSGYHLALLRPFPQRIAGEFLFRSLQSVGVQYQFHVEANGVTRYGLSHAAIKSVWLPAAPLSEQAAIVRFLDHADRRIRRYTRAKQKLIKLLEEQKQAIIHRAVTRGLDPNVRLKPSGVEWLGDVPEHWEVVPLKRIGTVRIGLTYSPGDVCGERGTLVLRASNVRNGRVVHADDVRVSRPVPTTLRVREGDILVCVRSGSRSLVGKSALITREFDGVSYGAFMSLLRSVDNRFYFRVLNSNLLPTVMAQFETSTINQLTQRDLRSLVVPLPPDTERAEIADFLDNETTKADQATEAAASEITLLREYRTRLIADVVTGKLDVREAAARLPQEAEDVELLDETEALGDAAEDAGDGLDQEPEEAEA